MTQTSLINTRPSIKVNGETHSDLGTAITGLIINQPLSGFAHGEMTVTNWSTGGDNTNPDFAFQTIGLGNTLEIYIGPDEEHLLFKGEVTALEERYGDGTPQLIVLLQDKLHRLARSRNNRAFEDQSVDDIVNHIAQQAGLQTDVNVSSLASVFHQLNESDLAFLLKLCQRFGIALRLDEDTIRAKPEEPDAEPVALNVLDSALSVRLIADLNHQAHKTQVRGFNTGTDEQVDYEAEQLDAPDGTTAYDTLSELGWDSDEISPQPFARSSGEAEALAKAHFRQRAKRFIYGEIRCQGEPTLQSGREIELSGVSERLAGTYQVVHCAHRFDGVSGFETHLKVNKSGWRI